MPKFHLTDGSGATYEIVAPDENAALQALSGGVPQAQVANPPASPPIQPSAGPSLEHTAQYLAQQGLVGGEQGVGFLGDLARNALTWQTGANPARFGQIGGGLEKSTNALGITGTVQPQSETEQLGGAAVRGGIGSLPMLATGGGALPLLLSGASGGAIGEYVHQLFPDSKWAPVIASILAGAGSGAIVGAIKGNTIEGIAKQLGESTTPQQAGVPLQQAARDWKTSVMPSKLAIAEAPVNAKVPGTADVPLDGLSNAIDTTVNKAGQATPLANEITSGLPQRLQKALQKMTLPGATAAVPWDDARTLRNYFGNLMANPSLIKDTDAAMVSYFYKAINDDLSKVATAHGAGDEWNAYNTEANRLYGIAEGPMSRIISSTNPTNETIKPEDAATAMLNPGKKGGTDLATLRNEIPDAVDELAASTLRTPGAWQKLKPEAQEALIPHPGIRSMVDSSIQLTPKLFEQATDKLKGIFGENAGHNLGIILGSIGLLGGGGWSEHGAIGGLAGLAAPTALNAARHTLSNPTIMRGAAAGALGGNALMPQKPEPLQ